MKFINISGRPEVEKAGAFNIAFSISEELYKVVFHDRQYEWSEPLYRILKTAALSFCDDAMLGGKSQDIYFKVQLANKPDYTEFLMRREAYNSFLIMLTDDQNGGGHGIMG